MNGPPTDAATLASAGGTLPAEESIPAGPLPLSRTARFAWGAVVIILIGVVVYAFTGPAVTSSVATPTPTSPSVTSALAHVPSSMFDTVGAQVTASPTPLTPPRLLSRQPRLIVNGKPEVLFVGAGYCPFCAAERWPLVVALSRFGRFTGLHDAQSASDSVFGDIPTFLFTGTHFDSPYLAFEGVELYSNVINPNGTYVRIASLTPAQSALMDFYGDRGRRLAAAIPFLDIANRMVATTSGFSPAVVTHQSQSDITGALSQPDNVTGQAIVAAANQLTVGLCLATGQQPTSVCRSKGVRAAAASLGLS